MSVERRDSAVVAAMLEVRRLPPPGAHRWRRQCARQARMAFVGMMAQRGERAGAAHERKAGDGLSSAVAL